MRSWKGKCIAFLGLCALCGVSARQAQAQAGYYTSSEVASWKVIHDDFKSAVRHKSGAGVVVGFGNSVNFVFPLYTDGGNVEVDAFQRYQTWVGVGPPGNPLVYKATVGADSFLGWEALSYNYPPSGPVLYTGVANIGGSFQIVSSPALGHNGSPFSGSVDCSLNMNGYAHLPGNMKVTASGTLTWDTRGHHWANASATFPDNTQP